MTIWAVLPVKEMVGAKERLSPLLSPEERVALMRVMVGEVLAALSAARGLAGITVVTLDPWATAAAPSAAHSTSLRRRFHVPNMVAGNVRAPATLRRRPLPALRRGGGASALHCLTHARAPGSGGGPLPPFRLDPTQRRQRAPSPPPPPCAAAVARSPPPERGRPATRAPTHLGGSHPGAASLLPRGPSLDQQQRRGKGRGGGSGTAAARQSNSKGPGWAAGQFARACACAGWGGEGGAGGL